MSQTVTFGSVLEDTGQLTLEEQEALVEVLRRRIAEQRHQRIVDDVREGEAEYLRGECQVMTVEELMAELTAP